MEEAHLKLFLTEELYLLPDDQKTTPPKPESAPQVETVTETVGGQEPTTVAEEPFEPVQAPAPITQEELVKHPIIVVSETLSGEEKELMNNILKAVNIKPNQIHHIVGQPQSNLSYDKLIVFGSFVIEGVDSEYYNVTRTTQMSLRARPLSEVNGNREEKTRLWNSLKTWFGL